MDINANQAGSFIAVAHFSAGDETILKSTAFSPTSTIADVFAAFWPAKDDQIGNIVARTRPGRLPFKIEILPDIKTVPADEPTS